MSLIDTARQLLRDQCPQWADHPLILVSSGGTDNDIVRLGDDLCMRLPRSEAAAAMLKKELACLPGLSGLSLRTPSPHFAGAPAATFEWPWAVYDWLPGTSLFTTESSGVSCLGDDLAALLLELRRHPPSLAPPAGKQNNYRGAPLVLRDSPCRASILDLTDAYDPDKLNALWSDALDAASHSDQPVVVHGDLHPGNLLVHQSRLAGVIDWGLMGAGDPAVDLMAAWTICDQAARQALLERLSPGNDLLRRAKGWALSFAVIALAYYRHGRNEALSSICRRTLEQVLTDT